MNISLIQDFIKENEGALSSGFTYGEIRDFLEKKQAEINEQIEAETIPKLDYEKTGNKIANILCGEYTVSEMIHEKPPIVKITKDILEAINIIKPSGSQRGPG